MVKITQGTGPSHFQYEKFPSLEICYTHAVAGVAHKYQVWGRPHGLLKSAKNSAYIFEEIVTSKGLFMSIYVAKIRNIISYKRI